MTIAADVLSSQLRDAAPDDVPAAENSDRVSALELQCATCTVERGVPSRYAADLARRLRMAK